MFKDCPMSNYLEKAIAYHLTTFEIKITKPAFNPKWLKVQLAMSLKKT